MFNYVTSQSVGLAFNIAGTAILSLPMWASSLADAARAANTFWRDGVETRYSATQRTDGRVGLLVLGIGFVLQLADPILRAPLFSLCALAVLVAFLAIYRARLRRWMIAREVGRFEQEQSPILSRMY